MREDCANEQCVHCRYLIIFSVSYRNENKTIITNRNYSCSSSALMTIVQIQTRLFEFRRDDRRSSHSQFIDDFAFDKSIHWSNNDEDLQ